MVSGASLLEDQNRRLRMSAYGGGAAKKSSLLHVI
uniref:Uncharacterized protein n=1 Tax=Arundo donax TaxID=35708 RepID=A0A0A9F4Y5_ARUDO